MPFTVGTPYSGPVPSPAYSGVFIPEIWAGKLIEKFYDATVLAAIANTDYEGEISDYGDKVTIRQKPTIDIRTYAAEQALTVDRPSSNVVELLIDQGRYWNTVLDDVMEVQSDLNQLSMWADDASEQMKIKIDQHILQTSGTSGMLGQAVAANRGATAGADSANINLGAAGGTNGSNAVSITSSNIIDTIVNAGQVLDEQNIPESGRWFILPPWVAARIKKSELRDASLSGDGASMLRNGRLGMIDRFTLYSSNLLPTATEGTATLRYLYAGHSHGLTFASQLAKTETLRSESTFGTLLRGLQVFGFKVTDGTALVEMVTVQG